MNNVLNKLIEIQSELKAPKGQYNSFGKYYYRSCEDILEALKPIIIRHKCAMYISDDVVSIGERYYVKSTITVVDIESGESISNTGYAREEENKKNFDGSQLTGTASSYARKYALNGLFLIDDTRDSDTNEFTNQVNNSPQEAGQLICPECGNPINGFKRPDGTEATPKEVYLKLGKCIHCHKKSKTVKPDTNAEPEIIP